MLKVRTGTLPLLLLLEEEELLELLLLDLGVGDGVGLSKVRTGAEVLLSELLDPEDPVKTLLTVFATLLRGLKVRTGVVPEVPSFGFVVVEVVVLRGVFKLTLRG